MIVSVIIPCYNVEQYISTCIASVQNQTYSDLEIICINDGSTDSTEEVIKTLMDDSSIPIQLIAQVNSGACAARNNGLTVAKGDYIQFLDADDILEPKKIEHQIELSKENDLPDFIIGSYRRQTESGKIQFTREYNSDQSSNIWLALLKTDIGNTCSNLFNTNLFKNGVQWNVDMKSSQESELMFQILKQREKVYFDPKIYTTIISRDSGSISQINLDKKWIRYVQLRIDIINFLKSAKPEFDFKPAYQILFDAIRILYGFKKKEAIRFFKQSIPKEFIPEVSAATGKGYINLYKILGFKLTEQTRAILSKNKAR